MTLTKFINKAIAAHNTTLDFDCLDAINANINMAVPWYLIASYAYYEEDDPILSDQAFDTLAKRLLLNWETVEHMHKEYLNPDMLRASTFSGEYPTRVPDSLKSARKIFNK